jgi:hypothetical protein
VLLTISALTVRKLTERNRRRIEIEERKCWLYRRRNVRLLRINEYTFYVPCRG